MTRSILAWTLSLGILGTLATTATADVIIRGLFGGRIVVLSADDVRVGPASVVVNPASDPILAPKVIVTAPPPTMIPPVSPVEFARTFLPTPGHYDVTFLHSRTNQPVMVSFDLPPGTPRVSYFAHSLLFDYGRYEVEIRFQIGGKVKVFQR